MKQLENAKVELEKLKTGRESEMYPASPKILSAHESLVANLSADDLEKERERIVSDIKQKSKDMESRIGYASLLGLKVWASFDTVRGVPGEVSVQMYITATAEY